MSTQNQNQNGYMLLFRGTDLRNSLKLKSSIPFTWRLFAAMHSGTLQQTGYAPVNGLRVYYEIHGLANPEPPSLVLLHGGGDTIETSFGHLLPILARSRQIIAFEQQGCGRTADIEDRPFSFEQSADDTAALLKHLNIERADFLGFSNG